MNRVSLTINTCGEVTRICSDERIEFYWVLPDTQQSHVHRHPNIDVGPQHVRGKIGGGVKTVMSAEDEQTMDDILAKGRTIIMEIFAREQTYRKGAS